LLEEKVRLEIKSNFWWEGDFVGEEIPSYVEKKCDNES